MTLIIKMRDIIVAVKVYMARTVGYIAILNSCMILFLFLSKLKEVGIVSFSLDTYFIPIVIITFFLFVFIGWFEIKVLKAFSYEQSFGFRLDPCHMDMMEKLTKLVEMHEKQQNEHLS